MRTGKTILILYVVFTVCSCRTPRILTRWKEYHQPYPFTNIMVAAVVTSKDDSLRSLIEIRTAEGLKNTGYNAISSMQKFGARGLRELQQQETYLKLCNEGIDAVLVITLIDESKETQFKTKKSYKYPHNYYYNRIWNYRNIQADLSQAKASEKSQYFWEAILFNLNTLEAECTIQSDSFSQVNAHKAQQFSTLIIKKMISEKILKRREQVLPRAF